MNTARESEKNANTQARLGAGLVRSPRVLSCALAISNSLTVLKQVQVVR